MQSIALYRSPIGILKVASGEHSVTSVMFVDEEVDVAHAAREVAGATPAHTCVRQLAEYFAGRRREFALPLAPSGTDFEQRVWDQLRTIPYGRTQSYVELARQLSLPGGARAVGAANARNKIAIITPCHRVIGHNGTLTGYAGGLWRKQWLLEHEGAIGQARLTL
jgi:methylated-DNA-[protein]-cysteine S-methyltransferase